MKKILFFSRDPGAANVIIPVFRNLSLEVDFEVELYGKEYALETYRRSGFEGKDISKESDLQEFLLKHDFAMVVTGTTSDEYTDRLLWQAATAIGIPSLAILDQWMNYKKRFTLAPPGQAVSIDDEIVYPDYICVMDEQAKREMINEGVPTQKIVVTGQPYFETTREVFETITVEKKSELRASLAIQEDDLVIAFASEPIVESYSESLFLGYNQLTIIEELIRMLKDYSVLSVQKVILLIKLHPRNNPSLFVAYQNIQTEKFQIIVESQLTPQETIVVSDVVTGMSSMLLLEAALAEKPILSVQIGLNKEDPFILSRLGLTKTVLFQSDLEVLFRGCLNRSGSQQVSDSLLVSGATTNIINLIEQELL